MFVTFHLNLHIARAKTCYRKARAFGVRVIEDSSISHLSSNKNLSIMRIPNFIIGILVVVIAALLFADGVLGYVGTFQLMTLRGVKLAVGFVLLVVAAAYLQKTK